MLKQWRCHIIIRMLLIIYISIAVSNILHASDMLIENYSFESGLSGWVQTFGTEGISISTEQKYDGDYSLKIEDTSKTASTGMESEKMPASPGNIYIASARVYILSGAIDLDVRFWDNSKKLIASTSKSKGNVIGEWSSISVGATAPTGTTYISIVLYSNVSNTGIAYYDCIGITKQFTTLGTQVRSATCFAGAFGKDQSGDDVLYTVKTGSIEEPAKFYQIDVNTLAVRKNLELSGAREAWAITVASDGKVYVGSYPKGHLYRYAPASDALEDLGQPAKSESDIWDLQPGGNGKVYGGTYPNSYVFEYGEESFRIFGPNQEIDVPFDLDEQYIRSLAYDSANNVLYVGVGSHAKLYRYECNTGHTESILPLKYQHYSFVYNINYLYDKVFVLLAQPRRKGLVLNVTKTGDTQVDVTIDCEIDNMISLGVTPVVNDNVYYIGQKDDLYYLCNYNLKTNTYDFVFDGERNLVEIPFEGSELTMLKLTNQIDFPGYSFVAIGRHLGQIKVFKYNLETGNKILAVVEIDRSPLDIHSIAKGPDGNIYSSGTVTGGTGIYTPLRSDRNREYSGIGQCENMITGNNKMYFGVYPRARIYEYDPSASWTIDSGGFNPKLLFDLVEHEQDRPFGLAYGDGKLFVGTVPNYGKLGGALAIYDTQSGVGPTVIRNIVQDQSVISLVYKDGVVYGGTSISGGAGSTPTQDSAKFFAYRVLDGLKLFELTPMLGKKAIIAVTVGPDEKIWGLLEGYLFIYNPTSGAIEYIQQKFPAFNPSGWKDGVLEAGKDGGIYGTLRGGLLFRIDPSTKSITTLFSSGEGSPRLAQDDFGFLYFTYGTVLKRYCFTRSAPQKDITPLLLLLLE